MAVLADLEFLREAILARRVLTVNVRLVRMVVSDLYSDRREDTSELWALSLARTDRRSWFR